MSIKNQNISPTRIEDFQYASARILRNCPQSSMSVQYKRFLKLLEKWPVDKSKVGRDLGEHLRDQLKSTLRTTNKTIHSDDLLNKQFNALERISLGEAAKKYPRLLHSATATGLTGEQCNQVLSSEFLEYLNEDKSTKK